MLRFGHLKLHGHYFSNPFRGVKNLNANEVAFFIIIQDYARLDRILIERSGCYGHACVAMWRNSRENMPTTSVGMAPNTLH